MSSHSETTKPLTEGDVAYLEGALSRSEPNDENIRTVVNRLIAIIQSRDERIRALEAENADLRRAVPLIADDGSRVWPSVHDNPTVLRSMLGEAHAEIERYQEFSNKLAGILCTDHDDGDAEQELIVEQCARRASERIRAAISKLDGIIAATDTMGADYGIPTVARMAREAKRLLTEEADDG